MRLCLKCKFRSRGLHHDIERIDGVEVKCWNCAYNRGDLNSRVDMHPVLCKECTQETCRRFDAVIGNKNECRCSGFVSKDDLAKYNKQRYGDV